MQHNPEAGIIAVASVALDGNTTVQTVNARELHAFLEVGKHFKDWIRDRIDQYGFVENQDFTIAAQNGAAIESTHSPIRGGHNRVDYHISLDMAKEISMVERNEKGREARRYFIECERRLREPATDEETVAVLYLESVREKKRLQGIIASNTLYPKVTAEPGKQHISIKDIKRIYAPYLAEPKIRLALRWYGQGRTRFQFGLHENANLMTFQRDGIDEVFENFLKEATQRISSSRTSVIIDHECFDGETSRVPRDLAVEYLGYRSEQFED
jgi:phage anti-repressor protein